MDSKWSSKMLLTSSCVASSRSLPDFDLVVCAHTELNVKLSSLTDSIYKHNCIKGLY